MVSNNIRNLFFHSIWYLLLLVGFLGGYINDLFMPILKNQLLLYFIVVLVTLLYSIIIFALFIKPTGRVLTDITSNGSLIALDIVAITGTIMIMILGRLDTAVVAAAFFGSVAQIVMLLLVMALKEK